MDTALNSAHYWNERHRNRSDEWKYRYATKDEITTNLFRGQDEPYARLGGRPFTRPSLQTGNPCETSRCVIKDRVEQAIPRADNFRSAGELPGENIAPQTLTSYIDCFPGGALYPLGVGEIAEGRDTA